MKELSVILKNGSKLTVKFPPENGEYTVALDHPDLGVYVGTLVNKKPGSFFIRWVTEGECGRPPKQDLILDAAVELVEYNNRENNMIEAKATETALGTVVVMEYDQGTLAMFIAREDTGTYKPTVGITAISLEDSRYEGELVYSPNKGTHEIVWDGDTPEDWEDIEDAANRMLTDACFSPVTVKVVFSAEDVKKMLDGTVLDETATVKVYDLNTKEESEAFIKGLAEGVGWHEHYVVSKDEEWMLPEHLREDSN